MKWRLSPVLIGLAANLAAQEYVQPKMGGGQAGTAPMIHIDIYYDSQANHLSATLDTSYGVPELLALEPGLEFDPTAPYAGLQGKAYNYQYGWNVGGFFSLPPGAAIWIRQLDSSPGLECYDGRGTRGEYDPIFGTADSPPIWRWSGVMVHNTYAIREPATDTLHAEYLVYFGDSSTGSAGGFEHLDSAVVRLEWRATPRTGLVLFQFGADNPNHGTPLKFLNASDFEAQSEFVLNLDPETEGPQAGRFTCSFPMVALAATSGNGGPTANHAALGSCLELEMVSLAGPAGADLEVWEPGESQPAFSLAPSQAPSPQRIRVSENDGQPGSDPFGRIEGRRFAVKEPGFYALKFRILDTSANGPDGGPIHSASEVYTLFLQAGLTVASLQKQPEGVTIVFAARAGQRYSLQSSPALEPSAPWQTVAGPLTGTNRLQRLTSQLPTAPTRFYRIQADQSPVP